MAISAEESKNLSELIANGLSLVNSLTDSFAEGETLQFAATTPDTANFSRPAAAAGRLKSCVVRCSQQIPNTKRINVSLDGGATFSSLAPGEVLDWEFDGSPVTQLILNSNVSGVSYEIIINRVT